MIHDPVKMVVVSIISVAILGIYVFFHKVIFKKNISYPFLLLLISFLPLISLLRPGVYESGDLGIHASYAISFFESLKEGNFIPVWERYMLSGFGYPYFLFTYPLPYYLTALVHMLGFSFVNALKLVAAISFISSGLAMYALVKEETKKAFSGFIAGIFYLFAPYHLVDLHFRFAIGEIISFSLLPTALYFLKKSGSNSKFYIFLIFAFFLLILSHQAISLVGLVILIAYSTFLYLNEKKLKTFLMRIGSLLLGVSLAAFYWVPALFESVFTHNLDRQVYFTPILNYIFSPSRFGLLYQGHYGELYFPVGYLHLPIFIAAVLMFIIPVWRKKYFKQEVLLVFGLILLFLMSFFMMLNISKPLWNITPLIKGFQFSYRFSIFCALFSSAIAGVILEKIKKSYIVWAILIIAILITILNWGNRRVIPQINDAVLKKDILNNQQPVGPGTTIWADADKLRLSRKKENLETVLGKSIIKELLISSTKHEYIVDVKTEKAVFIENTLYFPGWNVEVNGGERQINEKTLKDGLIAFSLSKGVNLVEIRFEPFVYQSIGRIISLITFVFIFIICLVNLPLRDGRKMRRFIFF